MSRARWLSILGFALFLPCVVVVLQTPPASGYETSVYAAYPVFFWVLVAASLFVSQLVVLSAALDASAHDEWRFGFLLALVVQTLLFFVSYPRGYLMYEDADPMTHLGWINEIEATGGGMFVNIYQDLHQLVLTVSYATGLEPMMVMNAVTGVASLFMLLSSYVLLSSLFDRRRTLMTLPFVMVLFAGTAHLNASPFAFSVLLFPFTIYLFVRTQQTESVAYRIAMAIAIVGIITYHPLTGLFVVLVMLVHFALVLLPDWGPSGVLDRASPVSSKYMLQLSTVTFVAWYYNYAGLFARFDTAFGNLLGTTDGESSLDRYGSVIAQYDPSLIDIISIGLVQRGQSMVYVAIGVALVATLAVLYRRGTLPRTQYLYTFAAGFGLFVGLTFVFLVADVIAPWGRAIVFAELFAAVSAGFVFSVLYDRLRWRKPALVVATVTLAVIVVLSLAGLYASPMVKNDNLQVTSQNVEGADWYMEHTEAGAPLNEIGFEMFRYEDALRSAESEVIPQNTSRPPDHFGYSEFRTLGASYDDAHYVVITERGRIFYPTSYPDYEEFWRFTEPDFERLEADPSVSKVYGNGEFDVYRVEPRLEGDASNATADVTSESHATGSVGAVAGATGVDTVAELQHTLQLRPQRQATAVGH